MRAWRQRRVRISLRPPGEDERPDRAADVVSAKARVRSFSSVSGARLAQAEPAKQFRDPDAVMAGNAFQDARQRPRADWIVQRDHLVVLSTFLGRDTHMRAALTTLS